MQLIKLALACGLAASNEVPPWACPVKDCALKSKLASAGPGFPDGLQFFAMGTNAKDTREACPFGGDDDDPEPSQKEYMKYMKGLATVGDMNMEQRRAYALKMQEVWRREAADRERKAPKEPTVDVTKSGIESVNSTTWSELRKANKFDFLITFYAPWCPHCKAFVKSDNAPIKALSASLEKVGGPKVVTFDIEADTSPLSLDSVPAVYLFKRNGQAIPFEQDVHNLEALMTFALDKEQPAALLTKAVAPHKQEQTVPAWKCPLKNCVLKSQLAKAGPAFADGVRFFAVGSDGKDTREACPFGGDDDEPEPSKKEYLKYMRGLAKVGDMTMEQRRAYALKMKDTWERRAADRARAAASKKPDVDVTMPGIESVNETTWSQLRNANKFDLLITFYAPWCPHCKALVTSENSPLKALSVNLEKANGPKMVMFDMTATDPPFSIDSVPLIYLFKTTGEAIEFEGNPHDINSLMAWTLDKATPSKKAKQALVEQHLRGSTA